MRFYKQIENGYISAIGTGGGGTEITEAEYDEIMAAVHAKPEREGTTDYRLTESLTWEAYEREPEPEDDDDLSPEEAMNIMLGGDEDETE